MKERLGQEYNGYERAARTRIIDIKKRAALTKIIEMKKSCSDKDYRHGGAAQTKIIDMVELLGQGI